MRQFHIGLNTDEEELKKTAILKHVVKTPKPKKKEVGPSISSCRNRKVPWGIVVSAGVDSDCRFTMMWARNSGGSHDCLVWDSITSSVMKRSLTRTSFWRHGLAEVWVIGKFRSTSIFQQCANVLKEHLASWSSDGASSGDLLTAEFTSGRLL